MASENSESSSEEEREHSGQPEADQRTHEDLRGDRQAPSD